MICRVGRFAVAALETQIEKQKREISNLEKALAVSDRHIAGLERQLTTANHSDHLATTANHSELQSVSTNDSIHLTAANLNNRQAVDSLSISRKGMS